MIKLVSIIDNEKWKNICKKMQADGIRQAGFNKLENVPKTMIINALEKQPSIKEKFLKYVVAEYLGVEITKINETPQITDFNLPGVIAYKIYNNETEDIGEYYNIASKDKAEEVVEINVNGDVKKMNIYLGCIDIMKRDYEKTFYNFSPKAEIFEKSIEPIMDAENRFPTHGNYAVKCKDRYFSIEEHFKNKEFFVLELDDSDIFENNKGTASFFIYIDDLFNRGKIHSVDEFNIYPIVTPLDYSVDFNDTRIDINEAYPINRYMTKSIMSYNGSYYGPFDTGYKGEYEKLNYIMPKLTERKYLLNKYTIINNDTEAILVYGFNNYKEQAFFWVNDSVEKEAIDYLTEEKLLEQLTQTISTTNNFEILKETIENLKTSVFIDVSTHPNISKERLKKVETILKNIDNLEQYRTEMAEIINGLFNSDIDESLLNPVLESLVSKKDFLDNIQNFRIIKNKTNEAEERLQKLNADVEEANSKLEELKTKAIDEKREELNSLKTEIDVKSTELKSLMGTLDQAECVAKLKEDADYYKRNRDELKRESLKLEEHIQKKINEANNSVAEMIFDEYFDKFVSDSLSKSISTYEKEKETKKYYNAVSKINDLETVNMSNEELISYLVEQVQKYRPSYDKNTIINLFICLTQNFITIFAGNPGTGKTSICNIVAHVLHLDCKQGDVEDCYTNRYVPISVERGWNSKRELIGYYNPLSRKIEKNNSNFYDALKILDIERETSKLPMLILLDEANLSPLEYYWADFNNICDEDSNHDVNLGDKEHLYIPKSLRFFATINDDHTTENISPRIIDRAFIVSLPTKRSENCKKDFADYDGIKRISWDALKKCFAPKDTALEKEPEELLDSIIEKFAKQRKDISPRAIEAVKNYCSVAQNLFEKEKNADPSIVALDYAISQRVITKISGHGESYKEFLTDLKKFCEKNNLNQTSEQLDKIIKNGSNAMDYYEYFC